jgi:hypothetical protein
MSRFSDIDDDIGRFVRQIHAELHAQGRKLSPYVVFDLALRRLFEDYLSSGKYDELIDYFTDQIDGGGGDRYFVPLSQRLVQNQDKGRVIRLWRAVIANRKSVESRTETLAAMQHFLDALYKLGDADYYNQVKFDMELFAEGKRNKLSKPDSRAMDESLFWQVIEQAKNAALQPVERPHQLTQLLEKFSAVAIKRFAAILQEKLVCSYTWDLWAIAYMAHGGCSDDGFCYFRAWLISEGKQVFERAISEPESLVDLLNTTVTMQLEDFLYAADLAYERRANRPMKQKRPKGQQPAGQEWADKDLPLRFPKAYKKFGCEPQTV